MMTVEAEIFNKYGTNCAPKTKQTQLPNLTTLVAVSSIIVINYHYFVQ